MASSHRSLNRAAIGYATMLSLACLFKGAVYDSIVAVLLLACLPLLLMVQSSHRSAHATLKKLGFLLLGGLGFVLLCQQLWPPSGTSADLWHQVQAITGGDVRTTVLLDRTAWWQSVGRLLFFVMAFLIALAIGASETSSHTFLYAVLVSGMACLALTFFVVTSDGIPATTHYSYTHGFVNPNNAAAYLGIMLLLILAEWVRLFKRRDKNSRKMLVEMLDRLSVAVILKAGFLLFSLLLVLAGLFMTGSRGGIALALLSAAVFLCMVWWKENAAAHIRKRSIMMAVIITGGILAWSFTNFGAVISDKIKADGADSNTRFDIFAAVMPMIGDHPLFGTGLGSFPSAFQAYRPMNISTDGIIDKAHNSYLEFAAEMGMPALALVLGVLAWMGWHLYSGYKERKEHYVTPACGLCVLMLVALYSLIDFPLQIPGIAAVCIAVVTVATSQADRRFAASEQVSVITMKRVRIRKRRSATKLLVQ